MHVDCNERYEDFRGIFKLNTVNDGLNFKTTFDHLLGKAWSELAQRHSEPCTGRMNKKNIIKETTLITYSYAFIKGRGKIRINSANFPTHYPQLITRDTDIQTSQSQFKQMQIAGDKRGKTTLDSDWLRMSREVCKPTR